MENTKTESDVIYSWQGYVISVIIMSIIYTPVDKGADLLAHTIPTIIGGAVGVSIIPLIIVVFKLIGRNKITKKNYRLFYIISLIMFALAMVPQMFG